MAQALVTGGTGFLGSNLALRLVERRWQVRILERSGASRVLLFDGFADQLAENCVCKHCGSARYCEWQIPNVT